MNVFNLKAVLGLDSSQYDAGIDNAKKHAGGLGNAISTAFKVGATAIAAATTAIGAFAASSVKVGMTFDSSMSQVAATMGYTTEELNTAGTEAARTFETLSAFAQEMGRTTAFSASEAADALNYMALAGYDADTSMAMLPNVLHLAAAGGIELAAASDMVTDASSALGLKLEQTADLVDQMAKASSKSNTSVAQLGEAILTVGGTARNLAGCTVELSTALGILADNGIKGAEGGTSLRNIILALSTPTGEAAKKMKELGLEVFDANGAMRPMEEIFEELNGTLSTMTQGEQLDVLGTIFNKVDLKAANALLATDAVRWEELADAIDNADGAAEAMAEVQLDNLQGDITLFKSALDGAKIAISQGLTPNLRKFVQFGSTAISQLTSAFNEGGLTGAMSQLGTILADGIAMITENLPSWIDAGMGLLSALGQGIMDNLPLLIDSAVQIVTMMAGYIIEALPQLISAGLEIIVMLANGIASNLPALIPTIVDVVLQIVDTLTDPETLSDLIDAAIAIMIALANGIIDSLPKLIEKAPVIIEHLVTAIVENVPKLARAALDIIVTLVQGIIDNLPQIFNAALDIINTLLDGLANLWNSMVDIGKDIVEGIWEGIKGMGEWLWGQVTGFFGGIVGGIKDFLGIHSPSTVFADIGDNMAQGIGLGFDKAMDGVSRGLLSDVSDTVDRMRAGFDLGTPTVDFIGRGAGMSGGYGRGSESPIDITLEIDGEVLARKQYRNNQRENQRHGNSLVYA